MSDLILAIKDVAEYLKVNERTIFRLAASGEFCRAVKYFLPVMGLIFLCHAYGRHPGVKDRIRCNSKD